MTFASSTHSFFEYMLQVTVAEIKYIENGANMWDSEWNNIPSLGHAPPPKFLVS